MGTLESAASETVEILSRLIQFDTTNPPGNERECISYIADTLRDAGLETGVYSRDPERPNLVARLPGRGEAPPLLLYGHVDVVTTRNQNWQVPPFEGRVEKGYVWGRGALDMKGGIAMMMAAILRAKRHGLQPAGDVIFAALSDEEAGGDYGARFMMDNYPGLFEGARFAIGEFGGYSLRVGGCRCYPIMVAEKQVCWIKATVRGEGGHGSRPLRGQAMAKLARLLDRLDHHQTPIRITPVARMMVESIAKACGGTTGLVLRGLTNRLLAGTTLALLGARSSTFEPLLRNTVSPTIVHASEKVNVIPGEVSVELDVRLVPGCKPEDAIAEIRSIVGDDVEFETSRFEPSEAQLDMGLFETLDAVIREEDPDAHAVPMLLSGATDGHFFSRLGIQTYGFLPLKLPEAFDFTRTIHAGDERVPVEALRFGTGRIYRLLERYGC